MWKDLTWASEDTWPAPHQCSLLGLLFLSFAQVIHSSDRIVWLTSGICDLIREQLFWVFFFFWLGCEWMPSILNFIMFSHFWIKLSFYLFIYLFSCFGLPKPKMLAHFCVTNHRKVIHTYACMQERTLRECEKRNWAVCVCKRVGCRWLDWLTIMGQRMTWLTYGSMDAHVLHKRKWRSHADLWSLRGPSFPHKFEKTQW